MAKIGAKIQNFENSKKVPLDILEIHVVSKFGPIRIKIAAGSLSEPHTHIHTDGRTFQYPGTLIYQHTSILTLPTYLPRTQLSCTNFTPLNPQLMFCYQALCADYYYLREALGNKTLVRGERSEVSI